MTNEAISHRTWAETSRIILRVESIVKKFGELVANDHVDFNLRSGEIHCLLGENGAGKTTLMNILYGLYQMDEGDLYVRGREVRFHSPADAIKEGIGMVSQQYSLVPRLTVSENIVLGDIPTKRFFIIDKDAQWVRNIYGMDIPEEQVGIFSRPGIILIIFYQPVIFDDVHISQRVR